jgi:hypothetical protein
MTAQAKYSRTVRQQSPDLGFDADVGDRIKALLGPTELWSQLEPAARLAGQQLELSKPGIMVPTPKGLWAGMMANVPLGQMLFVLADRQRVATFYCGLPAGVTALAAIDQMIVEAQEVGAPELGEERATAAVISVILEHAGAKPGETCPNIGGAAAPMFGALFSGIPVEVRVNLAGGIDQCTKAALCPVILGLIGPASSGQPDFYSILFPMLLPLAPYLEWILHSADPAETVQ